MNIGICHTPGNATLHPFSGDLWRHGRPKISSCVCSQQERDAPKLAGHLKAHVIGQNWVSTKFDTQDGHPIQREDHILLTAQVKGAYLGMKSPYQSLPDPMPYGVWGDPQEILKSLLFQELCIAPVGPRSKQQPKKSGPSTLTSDLVRPLH